MWEQDNKAALRGTLDVAHKLATTIARKQKRLQKDMSGSQEPQLKKASVDTGGIDINALIDVSAIILD